MIPLEEVLFVIVGEPQIRTASIETEFANVTNVYFWATRRP